jgi:hypothetical protein
MARQRQTGVRVRRQALFEPAKEQEPAFAGIVALAQVSIIYELTGLHANIRLCQTDQVAADRPGVDREQPRGLLSADARAVRPLVSSR